MDKGTYRRWIRWGLLVAFSGAVASSIIFTPGKARAEGGSGGAQLADPNKDLMDLGLKFSGAATCGGNCHGRATPLPPPKQPGDENAKWSGKDRHHKAFDTLGSEDSGKIVAKLGIADATKSEKCLGCHALNLPDKLKGDKVDMTEGVTCGSCHGPYEKWGPVHNTEGWLKEQREKAKAASGGDMEKEHQWLLTTWGIYDGYPRHWRAEKCTACHLAIDAKMVEAGHPQPAFELAYYSTIYDDRHWRDPEPLGYFPAQLWASGQAVSVREAMIQLAHRAAGNESEDAIKQAAGQAMGHFSAFDALFKSKAVAADASALEGEVAKIAAALEKKDNAAIAAAATAAADAAKKLVDPVEKWEPTKDSAVKALAAVTDQAHLATTYGPRAQEQQAYAVFALYSAYNSAEKPSDGDAVMGAIGDKLFPSDPTKPISAADFEKGLEEVKGKLPK